jgi:hypothetical protein
MFFKVTTVLLLSLLLLPCLDSLRLERLVVPEWAERGGSVDLLCEFSFAAAGELPQLDVKWYHRRSPAPFLVWIPGQTGAEPRVLLVPPVANHVVIPPPPPPTVQNGTTNGGGGGLSRLASRLRLEGVEVNLSGDYTCTVSTFTQELSLSQHLQVYGKRRVLLTSDSAFYDIN